MAAVSKVEQAQVQLVHESVVNVAKERDAWRSLAQRLVVACVALAIGLVVSVSGLFSPKREYFATTPTGQITPIIPLNKPSQSSAAVKNFAVNTVVDALSLNFRHWRRQLTAVQANFTTAGFSNLTDQLNKMGWLATIQDEWMTVSVTAIDKPVITQEGVNGAGVYGYIVEVPLTLTFEGRAERRKQDATVKITVVRVPASDYPYGVAVDQIVIV